MGAMSGPLPIGTVSTSAATATGLMWKGTDMNQAQAFIETCNAIAAQRGRHLAPATAPATGLIYRRVWPTPQSVDWMGEIGPDTRTLTNGWLDSSLDLRDGLSVVEVFTAPVIADECFSELTH
jgi:hypothetical protein